MNPSLKKNVSFTFLNATAIQVTLSKKKVHRGPNARKYVRIHRETIKEKHRTDEHCETNRRCPLQTIMTLWLSEMYNRVRQCILRVSSMGNCNICISIIRAIRTSLTTTLCLHALQLVIPTENGCVCLFNANCKYGNKMILKLSIPSRQKMNVLQRLRDFTVVFRRPHQMEPPARPGNQLRLHTHVVRGFLGQVYLSVTSLGLVTSVAIMSLGADI